MNKSKHLPDWDLATFERYRLLIDELVSRLGGVCVQCGASDDLEFDHVDWKTKDFSVATNWAMKDRERFDREVLKCQLLCATCHEAKTLVEQQDMGLASSVR